ncbi:MAG TPA: HIT domain-containing protein [Candidatus Binatia bacterium]|nr:HIT domain-containing protein [Candidatus Binatia bacterium]
MFSLIRKFFTIIIVFTVGLIAGGYVVTHIQPRNFIQISECTDNCFKSNELLGLLGSVGIKLDKIPDVILETDKTLVVNYPNPTTPIHYVIIPKKDIKSIEDVSDEDEEYIMDAIAVNRELVKREGLVQYRFMTNGPGYQEVAYLHFHLTGRK